MCGRYERRGDKQKIAEAFHTKGGLDDFDFGEDLDCAPGSSIKYSSDMGLNLVAFVADAAMLYKRHIGCVDLCDAIGRLLDAKAVNTDAAGLQVGSGEFHSDIARRNIFEASKLRAVRCDRWP
jgi:hypothetical protein